MTKAFHRAAIDVDGAVSSAPQSVGGSAFKPLGRNCPVCAGMRNDCRESPKTGLVHCRSALAAAGWRYIGDDSIGFGMYSDRPAARDSADFAARLEAAEKRKAAIAADKRAMSERALSVNVRDKQFTTIARHSGLSQSHRTKLEQRGYTLEQIERRYAEGRLWTWADDANIPGLSSDLPGATADGKLRHYGAGMAIAVTDENQRILGAQVRGDSGYFWVSSFKIGGCSPALKNGENPIGFYRPDSSIFAAEINLAEGFLKSDLMAELHGRLVIGAAGGNFVASSEQFERYLVAAAGLTGSNLVILNADGGSQKNLNIVRTYCATAKLVESLGYEFRVRWWGQLEKDNNDSDEIDSNKFNSAELLSWADFEKLVLDVSKGFKACVVDGGKGRDEPELSKRDWAIAKLNFNFLQNLSPLERDYKITRRDDSERDVCYYPERTPEFSQSLVDGVSTIMVRGWLAAGKTYAAIESLMRLIMALGANQQIVWVSGRNGLLRQTEGRLLEALENLGIPIYHFQDDVRLYGDMLRTGQPGIYTFCDAGLAEYHAANIDWSNVLVIVDEFAAIRANVPGNTKVFPQFKEMLAQARQLVVLDAFLGDIDCRILSKFRQGDRLILDQIPEKSSKRIQWAECRNKKGEISFSHDGLAFTILEQWFKKPAIIEIDQRYIVVADSLLSARVIEHYALNYCGLKPSDILLCCSETPEENHRLLASPNDRITQSGAKLVILTPTAESGIDIQVPFKAGLGLFCGVLSGTGAMQMIGRARQCHDWIISAPRRSLQTDAFISNAKIKRILERLPQALETVGTTGDARSDGWAVWQREIRKVQAACNSEFIHHLLLEHYESVETIELENPHHKTWIDFVKQVKRSAAKNTLGGDLARGQDMRRKKQQPRTDHEVWDLKLATAHEQHPQLWDSAIANFTSGDADQRGEAIAWARELLKPRHLESLRRYAQAKDGNLDDDNALDDQVRRAGCNYMSAAFKQVQNQSLYRVLNLESLATLTKEEDDLQAHQSGYDARSPQIQALYKKFTATPKLVKLFPAIEDIRDFWSAVKSAMRYFGFESRGETLGDKTVSGRFANGRGRTRKHPKKYFVGWLIRAESGSKFFCANFERIIESVRDRLEIERAERCKRDDRVSSPPPGQEWAVAA